jgi:hypothetical protein
VAIKNWGVTISDLTRVVNDDNLSGETCTFFCGVVLQIRADESSLDIFNRDALDVETNVVTWVSFRDRFMMHFN